MPMYSPYRAEHQAAIIRGLADFEIEKKLTLMKARKAVHDEHDKAFGAVMKIDPRPTSFIRTIDGQKSTDDRDLDKLLAPYV